MVLPVVAAFSYPSGMNHRLLQGLICVMLAASVAQAQQTGVPINPLSGAPIDPPSGAPIPPPSGETQTNSGPQGQLAPTVLDDPALAGMSSKRLSRLTDYLHEQVAQAAIPGAVVAIARRNKTVYLQAFGFRDDESRDPMRVDAVFDLSTLSQPITAVGALILQEQGKWLVSDSVGLYLDGLKRRQIILLDLLLNSAGVPASLQAPRSEANEARRVRHSLQAALGFTGSGFAETVAKSPGWRPAGQTAREGFAYDLLGIAMEKVSGQTLGAFLLREVLIPLDLWSTGFNAGADLKPRTVRPPANATIDALSVTGWAPVRDLSAPVSFDCGGACLYASAPDYLRFVRMLLNKGSVDGRRILSRGNVGFVTSNRLGSDVNNSIASPDQLTSRGALSRASSFGLGLGVVVRPDNPSDSLDGSNREFGRAAPTGPYFWADPNEQLAVVVLAVVPDPIRRLRLHRTVRALVRQAIDD